jgi:pimeloyl-ACP methyl ester carboxylesterase
VWLGAQWFKQTLDHFKRGDNTDTFDQKYFVDDTHYDGNGPIILYINGEAPLYSAPGGSSFTGYMAAQMKAMVVALEHRFYGDSHPFSDMSTSSLRYLNGAQALLDLRKFRLSYDQQLGPRQDGSPHKWVVVGGSYAGSLAAWARSRFPHLFVAAHASSAPIEAVDTFTRFDLQLQESLPSSCQDMVRQVNRHIDEKLGPANSTGGEPATTLKRLFDAEGLSNDDFAYLMADSVAIAVQYGQKGKLCDRLHQAALEGAGPDGLVEAFASYSKRVFYPTLESGKAEAYDTKYLSQTTLGAEKNARQWLFQQCTELGWFQVNPGTVSAGDESGLRLKRVNRAYFDKLCSDVFGLTLRPDVATTRRNYFADAAELNATRIFFTFGADDPWQSAWPAGRFVADDDAKATMRHRLIDCDNCAHCVDLGPISYDAPQELQDTRAAIGKAFECWLEVKPESCPT